MLLSVSRRTDIPAYYSDWFFRRLQAGFALVPNPRAPRRVSRVALGPDVVDGIVFWTKNAAPMLERLPLLDGYAYYFQFTVTAYGPEVEPALPDKRRVIVPAFRQLAERLGPRRVIWRYDPIFLSARYTPDFHLRAFEQLAKQLYGAADCCIISFLDLYRGTEKNMAGLGLRPFPPQRQEALAAGLAQVARHYGLRLFTCAESLDLSRYGIGHAHCVDGALFEELLGCPLALGREKNQRPACGCAPSVDLGIYGTCPGGCLYCYAARPGAAAALAFARRDPAAPLLAGALGPGDVVSPRPMHSCRQTQLRFD